MRGGKMNMTQDVPTNEGGGKNSFPGSTTQPQIFPLLKRDMAGMIGEVPD